MHPSFNCFIVKLYYLINFKIDDLARSQFRVANTPNANPAYTLYPKDQSNNPKTKS